MQNNKESEERKEDKEFKFMWGQKQSAMIAEAMLFEIKNFIDIDGQFKETGLECFMVIENGVYANYMTQDSILRWRKNSRRYFDKQYSKKLFEEIDTLIKDFFTFCKDVRNTDVAKLSRTELKAMVVKYQEFMNKTMVYFETSTPQGTYLVEQQINAILKNELSDKEKVKEYFIALSTPSEMDITMKQRIEFS